MRRRRRIRRPSPAETQQLGDEGIQLGGGNGSPAEPGRKIDRHIADALDARENRIEPGGRRRVGASGHALELRERDSQALDIRAQLSKGARRGLAPGVEPALDVSDALLDGAQPGLDPAEQRSELFGRSGRRRVYLWLDQRLRVGRGSGWRRHGRG